MTTKFGIEEEVRLFLAQHDLTASRFCMLVGPVLRPTRLSEALAGLKSLTFDQTREARKTMGAVTKLIQVCGPIPVSLRDPEVVKGILAMMEANELDININVRKSDEAPRA